MPTSLRIATFNVENLFSRAKLLNFQQNESGDTLLAVVSTLQKELARSTYDKTKILDLYRQLKDYIEVVEVREKLFDRAKRTVLPDGKKDWSGFIDFKRDKLLGPAQENTARVIHTINADICCFVEVEDRPTLKQFCTELLPPQSAFKAYSAHMAIDGNDPRGIDVALASRFPLRRLVSHVDDRDTTGLIFSRDCLEVEVALPGRTDSLWLLLNHFKSKGYGSPAASTAKRRRQAQRVVEILQGYDLKNRLVVVAGDFNDTPESAALASLIALPDLHDVLKLQFPDPKGRWTYHYKQNQQIDYLLVSTPLRNAFQQAGVERRGIHDVQKFTSGVTTPFDSVKSYSDSASDHGAVWADFTLP